MPVSPRATEDTLNYTTNYLKHLRLNGALRFRLLASGIRTASRFEQKKKNLQSPRTSLLCYVPPDHRSTPAEIEASLEAGTVKMNVDTDTQWAYWEGLLKFYKEKEGSAGSREFGGGPWQTCSSTTFAIECTVD